MIHVYGIPNCDTVKKALQWLKEHDQAFAFYDFKKTPPTMRQAHTWTEALGPDQLINRRGTTWRQLNEAERASASEAVGVAALIVTHASLIKRPLVQWEDGSWSVGFTPELWSKKNNGAN